MAKIYPNNKINSKPDAVATIVDSQDVSKDSEASGHLDNDLEALCDVLDM